MSNKTRRAGIKVASAIMGPPSPYSPKKAKILDYLIKREESRPRLGQFGAPLGISSEGVRDYRKAKKQWERKYGDVAGFPKMHEVAEKIAETRKKMNA